MRNKCAVFMQVIKLEKVITAGKWSFTNVEKFLCDNRTSTTLVEMLYRAACNGLNIHMLKILLGCDAVSPIRSYCPKTSGQF